MKNQIDSETTKQELFPEFCSLKTVKQKLNFWAKKMPLSYLKFHIDFNDYEDLHSFQIKAEKKEWEDLSKWFLEQLLKSKNRLPKNYRLLNLASLQKGLQQELKLTKEKSQRLRLELKNIDDSFKKVKIDRSATLEYLSYNSSYHTYSNYLEYGLLPDYTQFVPSAYLVAEFENGKVLAQYRKFIEEEIQKQGKLKQDSVQPVELQINQIGLYLEYTGLLPLLASEDKTYIATILTPLFGFHYKGIYDSIRNIEANKTKDNLERVIAFLLHHNLGKFVPPIEKDLKKLSNKQKTKQL